MDKKSLGYQILRVDGWNAGRQDGLDGVAPDPSVDSVAYLEGYEGGHDAGRQHRISSIRGYGSVDPYPDETLPSLRAPAVKIPDELMQCGGGGSVCCVGGGFGSMLTLDSIERVFIRCHAIRRSVGGLVSDSDLETTGIQRWCRPI